MKLPKFEMPKSLKRSPGKSGGGSGAKVPKPVADLYADLRDRRLLPLIAVLLVAIVAAPILLSQKSSPPAVTLPVPSGAQAKPAKFSVVPARPELRDYRKRLKHRKRSSPFSTYAAVRASNQTREAVEGLIKGAEADENGTAQATPTTTAPTTGATEVPSSPESESAPSQPPVVKTTIKAQVGYKAVVKAGYVGGNEPGERQVETQAKLPNEDNPVVIYAGMSPNKKGGLFLMTSNVTAYYGAGKCVLSGPPCQELKLEPGDSATFAVGYGETRYKVTLVGFVPVFEEETIERGR